MIDVMLLDSDDMNEPADGARARRRARCAPPTSSTSPGCARRRGASGWPRASIRRRGGRCCDGSADWRSAIVGARPRARCCWRAGSRSRLHWDPAQLRARRPRRLARGRARATATRSRSRSHPAEQEAPGLAGVTVSCALRVLAVARSGAGRPDARSSAPPTATSVRGRCSAPRAARAGSSARESGRRCCAIRTYGPALEAARGFCPMSVEIEVVENPARACAAMIVGAAAGGGAHRARGRVDAARRVRGVRRRPRWRSSCRPDARRRCGSATNAASRPTTIARTTRWSRRRCSTRSATPRQPQVHRMRGELGPDDGADGLRARAARGAGRPSSICCCSGSAPTAHTLSLFPDQASLSERSRLVVGRARRPGSSRSCRA